MDFVVKEWTEYIPHAYDNRAKYMAGELKEPITVELKLVTMKDSEAWARQIVTTQRPGFRGQTQDNSVEVGRKQFYASVQSIKNLSVNGKPILTAAELWDSGLNELVSEINNAVNSVNLLNEGDVGNLEPQSDGSSVQRLSQNGSAEPA